MKRIFWLFSILSISVFTFAQDADKEEKEEGWKKGATFNLNFSQAAMDNWAAGGENAIAGNALFDGFANYTKGKSAWDNTMTLGYGLQKTGDDDWFKNNDEIKLTSKYGYQATKKWFYSGLVEFESQFDKGYESAGDATYISNFFAPAYLNVALGMDYKPKDNFSLFISPLSGKFTFVMDDSLSNIGAFGVDAGDNCRSELGAYLKASYKTEIMKNVNYSTTLDLFSNYLEHPEYIDVDWSNIITFKINDYINSTLTFDLVYDKDVVDDIQWKETFCLGFSYSF